jgi:hypothetical protein
MISIDPTVPIRTPSLSVGAPSPVASNRLLILVAVVLWIASFVEALRALAWGRHLEMLRVQVPGVTVEIVGACQWISYSWWVGALITVVLALPLVAWATELLFSHFRSPVVRWLWGTLLIVPSFVFLVVVWWSMWVSQVKTVEDLRKPPDPVYAYLTPDGLKGRIILRECRRAPVSAIVETLTIEPDGGWEITRERRGHAKAVVSKGRLGVMRRYLLGRHLGMVQPDRRFHAQWWKGPEGDGEFLTFEFEGFGRVVLRGSIRARLSGAVTMNDRDFDEAFASLVSTVLLIEELVGWDHKS